jgi:hypothetical protein
MLISFPPSKVDHMQGNGSSLPPLSSILFTLQDVEEKMQALSQQKELNPVAYKNYGRK